jgi:hypothetical protein
MFPKAPRLPLFAAPKPPEIDPRARAFREALAMKLAPLFPGVAIGLGQPGDGPECCLDISVPGQARALSVHLLSHDFTTFKLLLAWRRPFDGALAPISLGGHEATIMGARLPGLTLAREVHLPELPDSGFVPADPEAIAACAAVALSVARRLSALVPARAA